MSPWISIISLLAWLILALGAFKAQRIGAKKTVVMALGWISLFFLVAAVFGAVR